MLITGPYQMLKPASQQGRRMKCSNVPCADDAWNRPRPGKGAASGITATDFVPKPNKRSGRACRHDQTAIPLARKRRDSALDLIGVAQIDWAQLYAEQWRSGLDYGELADPLRYARIPKDCCARHAG